VSLRQILVTLTVLALGNGVARAGSARITEHDGLVWAAVECGSDTLNFVVDTGAACSCVDLHTARLLHARLGYPVSVAGVGGRAIGYRCADFQGSVGGMRLPGEVVALDLSRPSRGCSQRIDGLIGADFFRGRVVRIDYMRGELDCGSGSVEGGIPLRMANGVMCVPVAVEGTEARWTRLDTGCTDAIVWCERTTGRSMTAARSVALASSRGGALLADVEVGTVQLHGVPVKLRKQEIFPGEAGLLGNAALRGYRVTIDGIRDRLELDPD